MPPDLFEHHVSFEPSGDLDAFLQLIPAKGAVYLLADEAQRPVQLLCVLNLRASLKRRMGGQETIGVSKRVNYRDLVRHIYWRRVDSVFEADWIYLEAARLLFPHTYQGMVGFRPAWFIHVDPDAVFPRYVKTTDLSPRPGILLGPVADKHTAARLIEVIEDAFDLCRYYNILVQAPGGRACAYKEMGKCPAPCDGSISIEQYRHMIRWSAEVAVNPTGFLQDQNLRMQQAAAALRFETAAKIKLFIEQVSQLSSGSYRHARNIEDFRYVSIQRGPRPGTAKVFVILQGSVEEVAGLIAEPLAPSDLLDYLLQAATSPGQPMTVQAAERIGIIAHHLFGAAKSPGVFHSLDTINENSLRRAFKRLQRQKAAPGADAEGVIKELGGIALSPP